MDDGWSGVILHVEIRHVVIEERAAVCCTHGIVIPPVDASFRVFEHTSVIVCTHALLHACRTTLPSTLMRSTGLRRSCHAKCAIEARACLETSIGCVTSSTITNR